MSVADFVDASHPSLGACDANDNKDIERWVIASIHTEANQCEQPNLGIASVEMQRLRPPSSNVLYACSLRGALSAYSL